MPGNIDIRASHMKPGLKPAVEVTTRCLDVNAFHCSPVADMLMVPAISMVTAETMGWPSVSTARK
jgi:hypothetical protein